MHGWVQTFVLAIDILWVSSLSSAQQLSDAQINIVVQNLAVGATHSCVKLPVVLLTFLTDNHD